MICGIHISILNAPVIGCLIRGLTCGAFTLSFVLIQKKQKIKENPLVADSFHRSAGYSGQARQKPTDSI